MARDTTVQNDTAVKPENQMPNLVTIVGRAVPSSFELTVSGQIEMVADDPREEATTISGGTAEGSIDVGVQRFRFSGEMANVHLVDWNGVEAPESPSTPTVHVDYGVSERE